MKLQRSSPLRPYWLALLMLVLVLTSLACGPLNSVVDRATGGGGPMQAASDLWSDVPKMDGLTASQMDMPLFAKVIFNTIVGNLGLLNPQGEDRTTGKVDWIAFDTGKTPDEVQAFYTPERMADNGWDKTDQTACFQGSKFGVTEAGSVCLFTKQQDSVQTQLVIITAKAEQANTNHVFFIRLESSPTPVPPAGAGAVQPQATVSSMEVKVNGSDARQLWVLLNGKAAVMVAIGDAPNEAGSKTIAQLLVNAV